jgi:replication-associated recombination protein RarA
MGMSVNNKELSKHKGIRVTQIELIDRLMLIGAPGIGKTEVIRQKAEEEAKKLNKIFIDLREVD